MIKMTVSMDKDLTKKLSIEGYKQPLILAPNPLLAKLGITSPEGGAYMVPGSLEIIVAGLAS